MAGSGARILCPLLICLALALVAAEPSNSSEVLKVRHGPSFLSLPSGSSSFDLGLSSTLGPDSKFEWSPRTVFSVVMACICALLANSAGVGGGPLYMSLFSSVLGFSIKTATALSHTVIACSGVASTAYGLWQPSPLDKATPLIDFGLALTFIPALLVGVGFGVLFNVLFPEWLQTLGLAILLLFVFKRTGDKALKVWRTESDKRALSEEVQQPLRSDEEIAAEPAAPARETPNESAQAADRALQFSQFATNVATPLLKIIALWAVFLALELGLSKARRCSQNWWLYWASQTLFCILVTATVVFFHIKALKEDPEKVGAGVRLVLSSGTSSGQSSITNLLRVVGLMVAAGTIGGILGIGGALIFNPFLLALGVHPQVTASTAVMMILFSSSSIALSFAFQGLLNLSYASILAPAGFISSLIGVTVVGRLVKVTGRASIIIFILTLLIAAGFLLTAFQGGFKAYQDFQSGENIGFKPFCSV